MTVPQGSSLFSLSSQIAAATQARTMATRFTDVLNVLDFGADPTGQTNSTPAIQACFDAAYGSSSSPHGGGNTANTPVFTNKAVFIPSGFYQLLTGLTLTKLQGARIFGGGRGSTYLSLQSASPATTDAVVRTNGCQYSIFEGINFSIASNNPGTAFDLDMQTVWTGLQAVNLQSNTFIDCNFGGGNFCVNINKTNVSGSQGSENLFLGCYFAGVTALNTVGIQAVGQNALMNCIIGGNISLCNIGISVPTGGGSFPVIHGVSFQNNNPSGWDVIVLTGSPDDYSIAGCRSETTNFVRISPSDNANAIISGCFQWNTGGTSLWADGSVSIDGCHLGGGLVGNPCLSVRGTKFNTTTPLSGFGGQIVDWSSPPPGSSSQTLFTVALLAGVPAAKCKGCRLYVSDSTAALSSSNIGTAPTGGGAITVPVYSDGTNWLMG